MRQMYAPLQAEGLINCTRAEQKANARYLNGMEYKLKWRMNSVGLINTVILIEEEEDRTGIYYYCISFVILITPKEMYPSTLLPSTSSTAKLSPHSTFPHSKELEQRFKGAENMKWKSNSKGDLLWPRNIL